MKSMIRILLLFPLWLLPWTACANTSTTEETTFITVRELMRLEGEQALESARRRRGQGSATAPVTSKGLASAVAVAHAGVADPLQLVGIYGVGKRLFAEVRSGSRAWLFQNGHSLPVGLVGGADVYRLKELAGACVRLERQGDETVLCLPAGGRP